MGFLDHLCGARQAELKVKDPDQLKFDPRKLVTQLAKVIVNIWRVEKNDVKENGFTLSLAAHPDYSRQVVSKVLSILERHQLCGADIINDYKSLLAEVSLLHMYMYIHEFAYSWIKRMVQVILWLKHQLL